jgi:hypothetical protein
MFIQTHSILKYYKYYKSHLAPNYLFFLKFR